MQVAFVASSSYAALPASLRATTHGLGVRKEYAAFAVPLGATRPKPLNGRLDAQHKGNQNNQACIHFEFSQGKSCRRTP